MRYIYFLFCLFCTFQVYPQFFGGNADGSGYTALTQASCAALPSYTFSYGGNADGHSKNILAQTTCAALTSYTFTFGGSADGHSNNILTQGACTALPSYNFSYGGNADGYSKNTLTQTSCASLTSYTFSYGGNADGFSYNVLTQAACPPVVSTIFYVYGGSADGSANNILTQSSCTPLTNYTFSYGGNADGFSTNKLLQTTCAALTSYTFSYGGNADGFSTNKLLQTTCAALTGYTFYRGSSGDGQFSTACGCGTCNASLPVQLLTFNVVPVKQHNNEYFVRCNWQTTVEINNDYFTIERGKDTKFCVPACSQVGTVEGAGNSSKTLHYEFLDELPIKGISYYRLKQTDYDGNFTYSDIVPVYIETMDIINIYPNPSEKEIKALIAVSESTEAIIEIINVLGEQVVFRTEQLEKGTTEININTEHLTQGSYIIKVTLPNKENMRKMFMK